jgi:hypothetical protein
VSGLIYGLAVFKPSKNNDPYSFVLTFLGFGTHFQRHFLLKLSGYEISKKGLSSESEACGGHSCY